MTTDSQTNFLYLADTLPRKFPEFYARFGKQLTEHHIDFDLLPGTRDVWAVDYMPIQTDINRFVKFTYSPSYLIPKKYQNTISDVDAICGEIGIKPIKSDIMLDGGNVIRSSNAVIMTDRIFKDNPNIPRKKLISQIHDLLQVERLYLVPEQPDDFTGHADGMVRFVDDHTLLINDYGKEERECFLNAFNIAIHNTGLDYIPIPYDVYDNKTSFQAHGAYINYLHMQNIIFLPVFENKEQEKVIKQFESIFSDYQIVPVLSDEIAEEGGILNCVSWNVRRG